MGKEVIESVNIDVEEGEISDSASIEEISASDFTAKSPAISPESIAGAGDDVKNKKQEVQQRVWTMEDLVKYQNKYQMSRNYAPGLYNFAWAQAVQNKPLDDYLRTMNQSINNNNNNNDDVNNNETNNDVKVEEESVNDAVVDISDDVESEKEEGEIEEGEIDLVMDTEVKDTDIVVVNTEEKEDVVAITDAVVMDMDGGEEVDDEDEDDDDDDDDDDNVKKWINVIRVGLKGITVNDAKISFEEVCSRLEDLLDTLSTLLSDNVGLKKDDLVKLAFSVINLVNSVFCSMSQNEKEQSRQALSRVLTNVKSYTPVILSPEQLKEVDTMLLSCNMNVVGSSNKDNDKDVGLLVAQSAENANQEVASFSEESVLDAIPVGNSNQNRKKSESLKTQTSIYLKQSEPLEMQTSIYQKHSEPLKMQTAVYPKQSESLKTQTSIYLKQSEPLKKQTSISKNRALLPLLDLHKDHDMDSLPSPTRETTSFLPLSKSLFVGDAPIRPEWPTPRAVVNRYDTDALKAVSSYQQKFSRGSFFSNDLPSPTPSEESGDAGGDYGGEVSSFSTVQKPNSVTQVTLEQKNTFSIPHVERPTVQLPATAKNAGPVYSTSSSVTRVPNKKRDPRLRLAKPESSPDPNPSTVLLPSKQSTFEPLDGLSQGSRKQKSFDETVLVDGPTPKRLKNESLYSVNSRDMITTSALQSTSSIQVGPVGLQVSNRPGSVMNEARGVENVVTTSSMPSTSSGTPHIPVSGVNPTSASLQSILKDIVVNPSQWMNLINLEQQKSVDPAKYVTQSLSQNSFSAYMPMTTVASQPMAIGQRSTAEMQIPQTASADDSGKVRMKPRDPRRALQSKPVQKSEPVTNISSFEGTKGNSKLADPRVSSKPISTPDITRQFTKNLKNIADIVSTTTSAPMQMPPSQSAQVHPSFVNIKGPSSQPGGLQNGTGQTSEAAALGSSQSQNAWGDVEHFFGKYDDQERAAIQKERSKRMDEQKKMFADRKLCLVLDLDHTLLNSAKFSEVEPMHDEMLKKKEEQDRDKPHRHLFRFPHMCMWTKLRPGIWKFLEKASKLYELHLYTMGNKLYATEMAKVLDPKGVLFNGRVISRGDDGDNVDGDPKSKDLEGVLGMESAVVIIDDSIRVWPHNKLNLIVVERYIYFPCSRRQFGLPGPSLLEIDHDERPEEGTLASSLAVIEKIHQNFYSEKSLDDADVRNILALEQRKILGGCRILFSRVFPVGEVSPHLHPLWQTAEQFGAVCTNQIDDQVTHVVANSLGTDKVNWALGTGRPVVHPGWVEASALLYRRANEHDFTVKS